jgi:hypothetical protein
VQRRGRSGASHGDAGAKSWLENGWETVAIQEEGDSGDFLFLFL